MLHTPTSKNKTKNEANNSYSPPVAEQEHRLYPPNRGQAGLSSWGRELSNHRQKNLQKIYGNQAVLRMNGGVMQRKCACGGSSAGECAECGQKQGGILQTKLSISEPGDRYEREADHIADEVMRRREPIESEKEGIVQRKAIANSITPLQSSSTGQDSEVPPIVDEVLRSPGQHLDSETRAFMESRFGQNFSQVRVHTDAKAANSAKQVNALAYTVGQDIVFYTGQYQPKTSSGKQLLAHELTHTLQQSQYSANKPMTSSLKPVQPLLQRKCGKDIGSPIPDCKPNKDEVSGDHFFFEANCDDLKPDEDEHIKKFVSSLQTGATLNIHGYASEEGTDDFNMKLSCHRTNKIANLLQMAIPATSSALSINGFFKHGGTKGKPLDYWRTVIVEVIKPKTPEPKAPIIIPQKYEAIFDGSYLVAEKNGKKESCPAFSGNIGSPTPPGIYCIRKQGEAQISGGIRGLFQDRKKWYLIEPQFSTPRSRMQIHPGNLSSGCITVDKSCFSKIESVLNSSGTFLGEGYDGYPPGNAEGVNNPKKSVSCIGRLLVK